MHEFHKASFDQDLAEVLASELAKRLAIERPRDLEVNAAIASRKAPGERFIARLRWLGYPDGFPSLKFLDPTSGSDTSTSAWPTGQGMRPESLDTCMHWTAEGHALHPEWKNARGYQLDAEGNPLLQALTFLQQWFDIEYKGRHGR